MLFLSLVFASGCLVANQSTEPEYDKRFLNIGVIGDVPNKSFTNVSFEKVEPTALKDTSAKYVAFFITDYYFDELSKEEWKPIFSKIPTPVFFINLDVEAFIYRVDGMTYENAPEAKMHTKGFVSNADGSIQGWGYGNPSTSTNVNDTPESIFHLIFRDIEQFWKTKENLVGHSI